MGRSSSLSMLFAAVLHASFAQGATAKAETAAAPEAARTPGPTPAPLSPSVEALLRRLQTAVAGLGDYTVAQLKRERFGESLPPAETMRLKTSRGRVYLAVQSGPRAGAEAIFAPGWNNDKVRIHKGSFPDVTLNLDRHGSLLMDGQHHPIEHAGFSYLTRTLLASVQRGQERGEGRVRELPATEVAGRPAAVLELTSPPRMEPYQVQRGDSLWTLAPRLGVDPYVLLHHNNLRRADAVKAGMTLQVPAYYGGRVVLALDKQTGLPSRLEVFDHRGRLYEFYEWSQFSGAALGDSDFSPDNPAYHF